MNARITVIIQYYLSFSSDWLFACYFVIIFLLVATAVCYSSILVSVTRRLVLMKVKVCYARVRVTAGTFGTSESTKTRLLNKRLKTLPRPTPIGEGAPPHRTPTPLGAFCASWTSPN